MKDFWKICGIALLIMLIIAYWQFFVIVGAIVGIIYTVYVILKDKKADKQQSKHSKRNRSHIDSIDTSTSDSNVISPDKAVPKKSDNHNAVNITIQSDTDETDSNSSSDVRTPYVNSYENVKIGENLYLGDILFLRWLDGKEINYAAPGYLVNSFGINPIQEKRKLRSGKYIETASPEKSLSGLRVTELKDILREANQKVSGRKKELIERIWNNVPDKYYMSKLPKIYSLSDKGQQLLDKYSLILWAHDNDQLIPLKKYLPYVDQPISPVLIAISLQEDALKQLLKKGPAKDYLPYPYSRYEESLSDLYRQEQNDDLAVQHKLNSIFVDYLLLDEAFHDFAFVPHIWTSQRIQSEIIDLYQEFSLTDDVIKKNINKFITMYNEQLPTFVKNSNSQLEKSINQAINLNPDTFHHNRISYLSKYINLQQLSEV